MEIKPNAYVWQQVVDEIKRRIEAGDYQTGMPLPGERRLSEELGVSVNSVRHAVRVLREEGWLETLAAKGTFVAGRDRRSEG